MLVSTDLQLSFKNFFEIPMDERADIVDSINTSLQDPIWVSSTQFIFYKYSQSSKNSQVFIIAKLFDRAIGYSIVRNDDKYPQQNTSYLSFIAIDGKYQKQGYGKLLLNETVKRVKGLGKKHLTLECKPQKCLFYENWATERKIQYSKSENGFYSDKTKKLAYHFILEPGL